MMDGNKSLKNVTLTKVIFLKHWHSSCADIFFSFQFDSEAKGSLEQGYAILLLKNYVWNIFYKSAVTNMVQCMTWRPYPINSRKIGTFVGDKGGGGGGGGNNNSNSCN
jgi:hypothetical protein